MKGSRQFSLKENRKEPLMAWKPGLGSGNRATPENWDRKWDIHTYNVPRTREDWLELFH